jgi:Amt family ammonium transporter
VLGFCSGIVAGLVAITPGAGFVSSGSAVLIAVLATGVSFFMSMRVKHWLKYDDALDTFGVHGVAGTVGTLLTAAFASVAINPNLQTNLGGLLGWKLVAGQATAMAMVVAVSLVGTLAAVALTKWVVGLRPALEEEINGLDYADHGERGWHLEEN